MDIQVFKHASQSQAKVHFTRQVNKYTTSPLITWKHMTLIIDLWTEVEAQLTASLFTTCIVKHLEATLDKDVIPVILYSDGGGYHQNRNITLSKALLRVSIKYNVQIEQKYLEKDHEKMGCDSSQLLIKR